MHIYGEREVGIHGGGEGVKWLQTLRGRGHVAREYWLSEVVQMPESFGLGAAKSSNRQVPVINLFVFCFCRFLPFSGDDSGAGKR